MALTDVLFWRVPSQPIKLVVRVAAAFAAGMLTYHLGHISVEPGGRFFARQRARLYVHETFEIPYRELRPPYEEAIERRFEGLYEITYPSAPFGYYVFVLRDGTVQCFPGGMP